MFQGIMIFNLSLYAFTANLFKLSQLGENDNAMKH